MKPAAVPLRYRALLAALALPMLGYTLWRALRDGGWRYLWQRLGFGLPRLQRPIWLHCASVGEVNAALPLLDGLLARYPDAPLLVTSNTPTGAAVLARRCGERVRHAYLPLDFRFAARRFLRHCRPRCGLIVETELWANLYRAAAERGVPLAIVNGRLSARTLDAGGLLRPLLRPALRSCLRNVDRVLARGAADAAGFRQLGAPDERVRVLGNLKFAAAAQPLAATPRPIERRYWLAASTHDDEELQLARIRRELGRDELLVIAPRHPERREAILRQLAPLGLDVAVRSRGEPIAADTQLYLADTLGELAGFIAHAELVFMGGSLIPRGGQNLLEPARAGVAIICGPHMENFADELARLRAADALRQVADAAALARLLDELLDDAAQRARLGAAAQALVRREAGVGRAYLEALQPLLGQGTDGR